MHSNAPCKHGIDVENDFVPLEIAIHQQTEKTEHVIFPAKSILL